MGLHKTYVIAHVFLDNSVVECNPGLNPNGISHRNRANPPNTCVEPQGTPKSTATLIKENRLQASLALTSNYIAKLRSPRQGGIATNTGTRSRATEQSPEFTPHGGGR